MKKTNLLIIVNLFDGARAIEVPNFADDVVKESIEKLMEIKPKDLQCEASSMGGGIYKVTKHYRALKEELKPIEGLSNQDGEVLIQLKYGYLYK